MHGMIISGLIQDIDILGKKEINAVNNGEKGVKK
jgi:hypothetical protein